MNFDDFKKKFIELQGEIEPIVKDALGQLLQREIGLQGDVSEVENLQQAVESGSFPRVALAFTTGSEQPLLEHIFLFEPDFVLQMYAWMISDEPAAEIGDEHLDGLNEGFEQVFGQIKMAVPDDQANYLLDNLKVQRVESAADLEGALSQEPAVYARYTITGDDKSFTIDYYCRMEQQAEVAPDEEDRIAVQPAEFGTLGGNGFDDGDSRNIDMLLDVNLEVTVELDRKIVTVAELLKLGKGSIVELEKSAGEPLDIFVNGRKFAEGEVVVIDDKFGIRITQLLSPKDRIKSLG